MKTLLLVLCLLSTVSYADEQTQCQQQGVYTDCTTTNTNNSGRNTETYTQCQKQGNYTDCTTSDHDY